MRTLGLIGGMSWVSTIEYYRGINERVNARVGGSQYPTLIIHSLNFADILGFNVRRDWDGFLAMTSDAGAKLRESGVEGILLCANTPHVFADRLEEQVGLPLINITVATGRAIKTAGLAKVALLGTRSTMELDFFKGRLAQYGIDTVIPGDEDRTFIHDSILHELGQGIMRDDTRSRYVDVIHSLAAQGAEGAVLGCTEIPLLVKPEHTALPLFDTTAIHVEAAVDFILSG